MPPDLSDRKTALQAQMLCSRLKKRYRHLGKWARRIGTDVFRLYDRDIPEIPLVLDVYGGAVSGALYQRPYEKDEADEERWLGEMRRAVSGALEIREDAVFLKQRRRQRRKQQSSPKDGRQDREISQYRRLGDSGFSKDVREGGLLFRVNLSDYLDTGLFPDHRKTRALVRAESAGKRVLNLFCYTASFSVYAASGGALSIDSVDSSNTYLRWGQSNFELNGFKAELLDPSMLKKPGRVPAKYRLIRADALRFLAEARKEALSWDLIILDPPTFSNSKKMTGTLDIRRDYKSLVNQCLALLNPGGKLYFSTNARRFRLDEGDFPHAGVQDITELTVDEDFKGKNTRFCYTFIV